MVSVTMITNTALPQGTGFGDNMYLEVRAETKEEYERSKNCQIPKNYSCWIEDDSGKSGVFYRSMVEIPILE